VFVTRRAIIGKPSFHDGRIVSEVAWWKIGEVGEPEGVFGAVKYAMTVNFHRIN